MSRKVLFGVWFLAASMLVGVWFLAASTLVGAYALGDRFDPTKTSLVIDARTVILLDGKTVTYKEFNKEERIIVELKVTGRHVDLLKGITKPATPPIMPPAID